MTLLAVPIISVCALIISLVVAVYCKLALTSIKSENLKLNKKQQVNDILVNEMKFIIDSQQESINSLLASYDSHQNESNQIFKQLEFRTKTLQSELQSFQEQLKQHIEQQPEDKLYSRAFKLAAKGADIEEIIKECELPRAEAEMLLSVYKTNQN